MLAGQRWSQSPVLPWARRAYETCLSAGSTAGARARLPAQGRRQPRAAAVGTSENDGALTRSCTELVRLPSECIAHNALRAPRMGPWRWRRVRDPAVSPMRCGLLRPPLTVGANGEGRKIRTSDLMHVTHPLWLAELCPREMVGGPCGRPPACRPLGLSHVKWWPCASTSAVELRPRKWSG